MTGKSWTQRIILSIVFLISSLGATAQAADLRLGVLANRGELEATARWTEFANYLGGELGQTVVLIPLPPEKVAAAAKAGEVDFVLSHSPHTVLLKESLGGEVLATLNTPAGAEFGGVIIAKKGSGIHSAEDLRGKQVMSLKFKSAAGAYIFQSYHLVQKGVDPHRDLGSLREGKKQDDLVLAVRNGLIDAAFVRTGLMETMQKEGKIRLDEFEIVDRREDAGFPFVHSTALYPEWCFTALPGVSPELAQQTQAILLKVTPDMPMAQKARIKGFVEARPLSELTDALRTLQIEPFGS